MKRHSLGCRLINQFAIAAEVGGAADPACQMAYLKATAPPTGSPIAEATGRRDDQGALSNGFPVGLRSD